MRVSPVIGSLVLIVQPLLGQSVTGAISYTARAYLDQAISILENSAYYRDRVDWAEARDSCYSIARHAQTSAETYDAIRYAVRCLKDHHSGFRTPDQMKRYATKKARENSQPIVAVSGDRIGYVMMPGFGSLDGTEMLLYVSELSAHLDSVAHTGVRAWVIDLRRNTGGNMWPMLASLLWFLPSDTLGYFVNRQGEKRLWPRWGLGGSPPSVDTALAPSFAETPMAVLQGDSTASSGEAILISTKSRPFTRTFGRPTSGRSSANSIFWMSDGAAIVLTTQLFVDRSGHVYDRPIPPDVLITERSKSGDSDLAAALNWLRQCVR